MRISFKLQTVILTAIGAAMAVVTACWAIHVYAVVYSQILDGFNRKLLALSGGAAAFMDGDAHAAYQRRRTVGAIAFEPPDRLIGSDESTGEVVEIDPATGGARPLARATPFRSLARTGGGRLFALSGAATIEELDPVGFRVRRTISLARPLDGLFADGDDLMGWRETAVFRIDPAAGRLVPQPSALPASLRAIVANASDRAWYGLSSDGTALWSLGGKRAGPTRTGLFVGSAESAGPSPKRMPANGVQGLALAGGTFYGAGPVLVTIDPATGQVTTGAAQPGFFSVAAPFYRRYRAAFKRIQREAGLTYLYTQVYVGGNRIYYIMDGTVGDAYSPPGSTDVLPDQSLEGAQVVQYLARPWFSPIQHWAIWGLLKSCFSPIIDSTGHVVAMAGADVDITTIKDRTHWALFEVVFVGVATLIAGGFVSYAVARGLTRPLRQIKNSALRIAAGNYGARADAGGTLEIQQLGRALDTLGSDLAGLDRRAHELEDQIQWERRRVLLEGALDAFASHAAAEAPPLLGPGSPGRNAVWHAGSGILWLSEFEPDSLVAAGRDARLSEFFGALLRAAPPISLDRLFGSAWLADPALVTIAYWDSPGCTLDVRTRRPVDLATFSPDGRRSAVSIASAEAVRVASGWRIVWPAHAREESSHS